jgi:hypothetical protein
MPNANRRTWQQHHVGHFLLTIHLEPLADDYSLQRHRGLARLTSELAKLLETHRLPATWAVGDPAHSAATSTVLLSGLPHEMAILGDPSWLGPTAGRTRFARELARRVTQSRRAEIQLTTLVPRAASIQEDIDLVVKNGLHAVAGTGQPVGRQSFPTARALHYGVWELPATAKLPQQSSWWSSGKRSLLRHIRLAAREAAMFHLVIDGPAVEEQGTAAERSIAWLVSHVAELRNRGQLSVETLGGAAARLSNVPAQAPQQSILRRAG